MSATARQTVVEFVLERMEHEPVAKRIELLRSMAVLSLCEPKEREALHAHADELEAIARSHAQLVLDFKRRAS